MLCAGLTPLPGRLSRPTPRPASATRSRTPAGRLCAKHAPLNYSVPLPAAEESTDTRPGPEELAIFGEQYADTLRRMQTELSALERTVLMAGLEGRTPAQTARELELPAKNVANALARARRKLRGAPTT